MSASDDSVATSTAQDHLDEKSKRKPYVSPQVTSCEPLANVTLVSGGGDPNDPLPPFVS